MNAVINKVESILTDYYSTGNYLNLMKEILSNMQVVAPDRFVPEFTNFSSHIEGYTHVGTYISPEGKRIIVMSVELKQQTYVENSRSTQRSYAKRLMGNTADAALIAFHTPGERLWRLSFVRLDLEMKIKKSGLGVEETLTPARRYSFLVGKDEPCHTAVSQLGPLIQRHDSQPTLDELESAFSVEAVTKEFFDLYKEKFHQLSDYLETNEQFQAEASLRSFTAAQFAKKLMGQIVFLYFLQKKGWLGVNAWPPAMTATEYKNAFFKRGVRSRELIPKVYVQTEENTYQLSASALKELTDEEQTFLSTCVKGEPWGTGPYNFMRRLFVESQKKGANFFEAFLEPLFYNALNVNRGEQGYDPVLHCRIPFLAGGLFEPIGGYEWEHNNFNVPNELFSNKATENRHTSDGILDIFDRYNFTMSEDEPLEREVAIDPEMLGKVFENLLEVNDRKSKGAFYTPREIVHYMCQESLINYLTTAMGVCEDAIRDFILYGDFMKDEDADILNRIKQGQSRELWISGELYRLGPNNTIEIDRMAELDQALQTVRVADPAVGSGAFPLGMLNEIVRARQNITTYMDITQKIRDPKGAPNAIYIRRVNERSVRSLKYETIRDCIFAVDIEPSAVDIAQLRLWLALVIDDEINPRPINAMDGHSNPLPLPNLEYNILCGNSLIDEFEGFRLINESELIGNIHEGSQIDLYQSAFDATLKRLIIKQEELYRCDDTDKKALLLREIADLRDSVIKTQLEGANPDVLARYEASKHLASKPYTLWQLDFARVFREKGGFDIVIGNPPYVQVPKGLVSAMKFPYSEGKDKGKQNLYKVFVEHAYNILAVNANAALIVQSSLMADFSASSTREMLLEKTTIDRFIEFPKKSAKKGAQVFDSVLQGTCICVFSKSVPRKDAIFKISINNDSSTITKLDFETILQGSIKELYPDLLYIPLIKSGEDAVMKKINSNSLRLRSYLKSISQGDLNLTGSKEFFSSKLSSVVLLRGKNISRYFLKTTSSEYVDDSYLAEKVALNKQNVFIVGQEVTGTVDRWRLHFALTPTKESYLFGHTANKLLLKDQENNYFMLGILNSKLLDWFFRKTSTNNHVMGYELVELPIPKATDAQKATISAITKQIIALTEAAQDTHALEMEINCLLFDIVGLTEEERALVMQQ